MRRLALALALLASVVTASPALADHGPPKTYQWTQRTVILEDRTGVQLVRDAAALVASRWNQSGANFTLSYRDGPATNACGPEGNVVPICEQWIDGDAAGITYTYPGEPGTVVAAWIVLSPPQVRNVGIPNIRAVLAHEVGHAICCVHSGEASIMNPFYGASTSPDAGPTAHDFDVLRAVYGAAGPVPTVAPYPTTSTSVPVTTVPTTTSTTVVPLTSTTLPATPSPWSYYQAWVRALAARYGA